MLGGAWSGVAHHRWQDQFVDFPSPTTTSPRASVLLAIRVCPRHGNGGDVALLAARTHLACDRGDGHNPKASRLAGVRSRRHHLGDSPYMVSGILAGIAGIATRPTLRSRRQQRRTQLDRALRDPRGGVRWHLAHRRQVQHRGHGYWRSVYSDTRFDRPVPGNLVGSEPGVLRACRDHRGAHPVAPCPPMGRNVFGGSRNSTKPSSDAEVAA